MSTKHHAPSVDAMLDTSARKSPDQELASQETSPALPMPGLMRATVLRQDASFQQIQRRLISQLQRAQGNSSATHYINRLQYGAPSSAAPAQPGATHAAVIQRTIDPTYAVTHGEFHVKATPQNAPAGSTQASLPITIEFAPNTEAPYSNQIGLIQIVRLVNAAGDNVEPQSLPAARGAELRTQDTDGPGVESGYFTDVLHNDAPAHGGTGTDAPQGGALAPQYPFGNGPAQPNPTTPGLSRPSSSGAGGAIIGYKRSNDPADIKPAELTDAPGGGSDFDFSFETVAKGEDTMTTYGALKWGFEIRAGQIQNDNATVDDSQSATFDAALERHRDFYVHEPVIFYFDFDRDTLNAGELAKIDEFTDYLTRNTDVKVTPEGFADQRGGQSDHNLQLSLRRASAVAAGLRAKGIAETQISPVTIGSGATADFTQDATTDQDREGNRQANRRVVLTFTHVPAAGGAGGSGATGGASGTP